jgi:hypothetical protein
VQRAVGIPIEPQLDWFHIGMRLERLRKIVHLPVTYAEYRREPEVFDLVERRVERVRHALWHIEKRTFECYAVVKKEYDRLFPAEVAT